MEIKYRNELIIEQPAYLIEEYARRELVVDNPEYQKRERMGLWVGNTPKKLQLYKRDGDTLIFPTGTYPDVKRIAAESGVETFYTYEWAPNKYVAMGAKIDLYDYQKPAVERMKRYGGGILKAPAGSGKTQMGIALANALCSKTLWLTHTHDLLKQSYDRAIACGIDKDKLGIITAGKVNIGSAITFATVQTLAKQDLAQYRNTWTCVIVDECHRVAGTPTSVTQFGKVISSLAARYKYGLSATVHRADGLIKCTYALLGPVAYEVPEEAVESKVMRVKINRLDTGYTMPYEALDTDGTIIYSKLITETAQDKRRNRFIADRLIECSGHYNLILSDRLQQLHDLYAMLPPELQAQAAIIDGKMTSKAAKAEREQAIEDMRQGKKRYLFASYKLAKEGLDIPRLDRLHMATPQKDYAVVVQSVGRVGRTFDGKEQPVCYDYVDNIGLMRGMFKKRCTHYKKCNCIL